MWVMSLVVMTVGGLMVVMMVLVVQRSLLEAAVQQVILGEL
jgi:hypothetical protein